MGRDINDIKLMWTDIQNWAEHLHGSYELKAVKWN